MHARSAVPSGNSVYMPVKLNRVKHLRPRHLPWAAVPEPAVGRLHLVTVPDTLREDAIFIPDAVTVSWITKGGHRIQKTGCKPPQTAIAETCILFKVCELVVSHSQNICRITVIIYQPEIGNVAFEQFAHHEFKRQVINPFGIAGVIMLLSINPSFYEKIPY